MVKEKERVIKKITPDILEHMSSKDINKINRIVNKKYISNKVNELLIQSYSVITDTNNNFISLDILFIIRNKKTNNKGIYLKRFYKKNGQ